MVVTVKTDQQSAFGTANRMPGRMGVVDIGSNTVRLVVYDAPNRLPIPIFNEKVNCELGRDLDETGYLFTDGVERAMNSLTRFVRLSDQMGVKRLDLIATAAVRDAADGPDFKAQVEERFGFPVYVPSGPEEARLAGLGLLMGKPDADGVLADMGGGSTDLVEIEDGVFGNTESLGFGHLRPPYGAKGKVTKNLTAVADELAEIPWLKNAKGKTLYAVGGSWRALARVFIDQTSYPLHVIDGYTVSAAEARKLCDVIRGLGPKTMAAIKGVPMSRIKALPFAAMVLAALLKRTGARRVQFSGFGVREGQLLTMLPEELRSQDAMLSGCAAMAERMGRFAIRGQEIYEWISPLFPPGRDAESRLRMAACMLSDIGWSEHPDYRAEHAFLRVLRLPFAGLTHADRVFLAVAIFVRYNGDPGNPLVEAVRSLMTDYDIDHANVTGLALRLAHTVSGSAPGILPRTWFEVDEEEISLKLPEKPLHEREIFLSDAVERRFRTLAKSLGRTSRLI